MSEHEEYHKQNIDGRKLAALLSYAVHENHIAINLQRLEKLPDIRSVIVIGSSNAGKTHFVNVLRKCIAADPELLKRFDIPQRVITRPKRKNDDTTENTFASTAKEFEELTKGGIAWKRDMGDGRTERYGFAPAQKGKIPIYSANNAIVKNKESVRASEPDFFEHALIITVYAPDEVRERRLKKRSPDLVRKNPEEVKMRLGDKAMSAFPDAHVLVHNVDDSFMPWAKGKNVKRTAELLLEALRGI